MSLDVDYFANEIIYALRDEEFQDELNFFPNFLELLKKGQRDEAIAWLTINLIHSRKIFKYDEETFGTLDDNLREIANTIMPAIVDALMEEGFVENL